MRGSKIFANSETYLDMRSLPVCRRRRGGGPPGRRPGGCSLGFFQKPWAGSEEKGAEAGGSWFTPPQLEAALSGRPDPVGTAASHRPIPVTSSGASEARARG